MRTSARRYKRMRTRTQIRCEYAIREKNPHGLTHCRRVSQCLGQVITWRADECHRICDNNNPRLGTSVTVFATITYPVQHGQSLLNIVTADHFLCTRTRCAKPVLKASKGHFCGCLLQARYIYAAAYYNGHRGIIIIIHVHVYSISRARVFRVYVFCVFFPRITHAQ